MLILPVELYDLYFTLPFAFGAFGFLKKIVKKIGKIGGGALKFVPGGSIIRQGLNVAKSGLGAIVSGFRGQPRPPETRFGQSSETTPFQQGQFGSSLSQGRIFGFSRTAVLGFAGLALVGVVFFAANKRKR